MHKKNIDRGGVDAPFLRWAGSKRQLIPILAEYWRGSYSRYLEPFAGSASLFFSIRPSSAILGDLNIELVNAFVAVRDWPDRVAYYLQEISLGKRSYYNVREHFHRELVGPKKAAHFIFLNRFCFNGLYRTNAQGRFNVPFGGHKSGQLPSVDHLRRCSTVLRDAQIIACDFETVLAQAAPGDFVYMDPPFAVRDRRVFREYGPGFFAHKDVERLRRLMITLKRKNIPFLVSYAESEEADALSEGFSVRKVQVRRNIAGFAGNRARVNELLISN